MQGESEEGMANVKKLNKTNMYNLVRDLIGNVPKMKDTEFVTHRHTCWLRFFDTQNDHYMNINFDVYMGSAYFVKKDLTDNTSEIVYIPFEDLEERQLLVSA